MALGIPAIDSIKDAELYIIRRKELIRRIKEENPQIKNGIIILFAGFENDHTRFRQDSSFFYVTGITEPGVVLAINLQGGSELYIPHFAQYNRAQWVGSALTTSEEDALRVGVDKIRLLGGAFKGYQACACPSHEEYKELLELFLQEQKNNGSIFTLCPESGSSYCWQRLLLGHINSLVPGFNQMLVDTSSIIEEMRRIKDMHEIEQLYEAAEITMLAHEVAAHSIVSGVNEREVQASLEYMITGSGAYCAFPSIVASGQQATTLHYLDNMAEIKDGELVIVDIGADYNHYCADITRTYPVSGFFSDRQRELYELVLETQEYIASIAKPGYWLSNEEEPDKSLNHLAKAFLKERGYAEYMLHGIGHFLGLDVHDVGDYKKPLRENDVITIEPGIYLPQESIGIRIEDDYWVVKDGVICLSEGLPKKPADVEALVQQQLCEETVLSELSSGYKEDQIDA